jgi:hypothetical protein
MSDTEQTTPEWTGPIEAADQEGEDARSDGISEAVPFVPAPIEGEGAQAAEAPKRSQGGDPDPDPYAIGGGWYQFPDGSKVQGRAEAVTHLREHPEATTS